VSNDKDNDNNHKASSLSQHYCVLIEFVYKHLDFQLAELQSILEVHGIQMGSSQCQVLPLPLPENYHTTIVQKTTHIRQQQNEQHEEKDSRPYHRAFTILAFPWEDALRLSGIQQDQSQKEIQPLQHQFDPKIPSKSKMKDLSIAEILYKCTLIRSVLELWGYSPISLRDCAHRSYQWLQQTTNSTNQSSYQQSILYPYIVDKPWRFNIHTIGTSIKSREEQDLIRKAFHETLDTFDGPVNLNEPTNDFLLIREIELDSNGSPLLLVEGSNSYDDSNNKQKDRDYCTDAIGYYFGRVLGGYRHKDKSRGMDKFSLKKRPYLGPTSMDAELSFVMTSLGLVRTGSIVLDPFVGTGSILLSCSMRGAYCVGTDIDIRVIRGKGGDQTVWNNFDFYGLPRPEIVRSDNALYQRHFRHHHATDTQTKTTTTTTTTTTATATTANFTEPLYDAIVTDPPYGIRAGARKSGSKKGLERTILDDYRHDHIAQTKVYPVEDVMSDLVDIAAQTLVLGGRLVYIIPSFEDFDPTTDLPQHDCLQLLHSCYQSFGNGLGRRIVVMKKICHYDLLKQTQYKQRIWKYGPESANKCANLRDKLLEKAKSKPGYEEKAAVRKQKRKANKLAKKGKKRSKHVEEAQGTIDDDAHNDIDGQKITSSHL
jgi:tRNA (guanine10-N2)-methyltransferase